MPKTSVTVSLIGSDSHALAIVSRVSRALRQAKGDPAIIAAYRREALSESYNHRLWVAEDYVTIE